MAEQTAERDNGVHPTDDNFKYKSDVQLPATVMAVGLDSEFVKNSAAEKGDFVGLILDKSSFYAEAGKAKNLTWTEFCRGPFRE
jgi:alanyl-tRNA synthetase